MTRAHPPVAAYAALAAVCFFWGTVYLGFRIAVEDFGVPILMGVRFFSAGAVTLLVARAVKAKMPSAREFLATAFYGIIILGLGIGTLAFAVQWIPSGLVAILNTTSPFWMVGIEALLPGGDRPNLPTIGGMLVGLAGTLLLVAPDALQQGLGGAIVFSFLILQLGCGGFALGSILERRHATTTHPIVSGAVQELATGFVFLIPALVLPHNPVHWTGRGMLAILYLIVFGGIVAYSSYLYAMKHLPVSLVSIFTYVNPVVALVVGSLVYGEGLKARYVGSMAIIFAGVLIVNRYSRRERGTSGIAAEAAAAGSQQAV
jgi:drug/metabolite transporter (DMT)-like permease